MKHHLKCKGQNNEDKGYHEPAGDAKREPFKKRLHPKLLGRKGLSNPPSPPQKKNKTKQNPKKRTFLPFIVRTFTL